MSGPQKLSPKEWPYNLWEDIVTERKDGWINSSYVKDCDDLLMGYVGDPYPPELYLPNLENVLTDALTHVQVKVIHLRYEQRMTYKQVGETLGFCAARAQTVSRSAIMRLKESKNFFRLKSIPEAELIQQIKKNNKRKQIVEELTAQKEELKKRNAELVKQIAEVTGTRKRIEERHKCVTPDSPIEAVSMNVRGCNALHRADINTVGELIEHTPDELLRLPHMGNVTVENIMGALHLCGYELKEN